MRNSVHPLELVVASRDEAHVMLSGHYLDFGSILIILYWCIKRSLVFKEKVKASIVVFGITENVISM